MIYWRYLVTLLVLLAIAVPSESAGFYSLYLVRHAEKQHGRDPQLTACGKQRAKQLAQLLSTANIQAIYSTAYQRTLSTAAPIAKQQGLAIKHYSPNYLDALALQLKTGKNNALIVGHSNTTKHLLSLLTNNKKLAEPLKESDYQKLYQLTIVNQNVYLTEFTQPLICNKATNS
jgi:phosphohistidine phosphatase SixA